MKKLTIDIISKICKENNYECLSDVYINNRTKMKFKCSKGHIFEMIWNSFQLGHRCPKCSNNYRYKFDDIINQLKKFNYKLDQDFFENSTKKLKLKCPKNHTCYISWKHFNKSGIRCTECTGNKKKDIRFIKNKLKQYNYICLDNTYINNRHKLNMQCPKGHNFKMSWKSFNRGYRCFKCSIESISGRNHYRWNDNKTLNLKLRKYKSKQWIKNNMQNDPNFNNYLTNNKDYHLDHIFPVKSFQEFLVENNLEKNDNVIKFFRNEIINIKENYQLLPKHENRKKSYKYNKNDLTKYINNYYNKKDDIYV